MSKLFKLVDDRWYEEVTKEDVSNWLLENGGLKVYRDDDEDSLWYESCGGHLPHEAILFKIEPIPQEKSDDEVLAEKIVNSLLSNIEEGEEEIILEAIKTHRDTVAGGEE